MARVLIGNDTGQGRGHVEPMMALARGLASIGHEVFVAVPVLDGLPAMPTGVTVLQAPSWPIGPRADGRHRFASGSTLADALLMLGLDEPAGASRLLAWKTLLDLVKPAVVVADFAPGLLLASRGRAPTLAFGIGYCIPPATAPAFPVMLDSPELAPLDEAPVLERVNDTLRLAALTPIERLPMAFGATRELVFGLAAMDPYRAFRDGPGLPPILSPPPAEIFRATPPRRDSDRRRVFAYLNEPGDKGKLLLAALTRVKADVRVVMNRADPDIARVVERHGVVVEPGRVHPAEIIASDLVVSFGSHRLLATCLGGGVRQVIMPTDTEKRVNARLLRHLDVAAEIPPTMTNMNDIAGIIEATLADEAMRGRAASLAGPMQAEMLAVDPVAAAVRTVVALADGDAQ